MELKGLSKFTEKIPWLSGKKIVLVPVFFILVMAAGLLILMVFDAIPGWLVSSGLNYTFLSLFPLIGELLIGVAGLLLVYQMWSRRDRLKAKYGRSSYQRIFPVGLTGITFVLSIAVSLYIPFLSFSPAFWIKPPFQILAQPLESFIPVISYIILPVRMVLAAFFLVTGLATVIRSLQTFGLDYMTLVYLYFPEEGQLQEHEIYSVLRHPAYSGALTAALGGLFFTFTAYSILFFIIYLAGFYIHVHFVEEKELLQRFGESFQEYRKKVPAFCVKPGKLKVYFAFLLRGPKPTTST
jgi:protein-S-isoprenylcysteine O-methyltransferase Ste14